MKIKPVCKAASDAVRLAARASGLPARDEVTLRSCTSAAPYKYPRWIEFVAELPKTPAVKIPRRVSGERAADRGRGRLSGVEPVARDVVAGGKRLETRRFARDPDRATIVLLHEGLGSIAMWRDLPERLADRTQRSVVAYSRYGYGGSDPIGEKREPEYMHNEAQRVLPELLDALQIERPVLFGHSDGASIALIFAGTYPDAAAALVLEAPHVFVEDVSVRSIAAAKVAWTSTGLRERLARYHADVDGAFTGWNDIWLDPRFREWNVEPYAGRVRCPTLIVQGDGDEYGTPAQVERIAARVPQAETFIVPQAGHSPHRDAPDAVLGRVAAFLERLAQ